MTKPIVHCLIVSTLIAFAVTSPEAEASRRRACGWFLAGVAAVGVVWEEVDYGLVHGGIRSIGESWDRMQEENRLRRQAEAEKLEALKGQVTTLRKDRKARVEYLQGAFEALLQKRNEYAAQNYAYSQAQAHKDLWGKTNARLLILKAEIDGDTVDELHGKAQAASAALPRSLNYDRDKAAADKLWSDLHAREVDLYTDLFANEGTASKLLKDWPRP